MKSANLIPKKWILGALLIGFTQSASAHCFLFLNIFYSLGVISTTDHLLNDHHGHSHHHHHWHKKEINAIQEELNDYDRSGIISKQLQDRIALMNKKKARKQKTQIKKLRKLIALAEAEAEGFNER